MFILADIGVREMDPEHVYSCYLNYSRKDHDK